MATLISSVSINGTLLCWFFLVGLGFLHWEKEFGSKITIFQISVFQWWPRSILCEFSILNLSIRFAKIHFSNIFPSSCSLVLCVLVCDWIFVSARASVCLWMWKGLFFLVYSVEWLAKLKFLPWMRLVMNFIEVINHKTLN